MQVVAQIVNPSEDLVSAEDAMEEQTQQSTQATQPASQPGNPADMNAHLWGYLQPCSSLLRRIELSKIQPVMTLGRAPDNNVILPGGKVSNRHCRIVWDGKEDKTSCVTIVDYSSNGTWINGMKIGKDKTGILKEGYEVAFGSPQPQPGNIEDYRFIYRHTAAGPPTGGLHAHYDLGHELGKGSFATVMKAVSRATGQWFAIKMIQENKVRRANATAGEANASNAQKATAFAREISILEKLNHPNICQLKEVFFEDANINLVLEYVDGGDLLDFILKTNGLEEAMARHITAQIAEALAYIHSKGIAHRDLKPENVMLTSDNPPKVKVADFGLAKVVDSLTFLKTMCGTPSYLAPEVVTQQNQEGYDHLVDSWSVGVIVFSMLTSTSPFIEDDTQRDIKIRIAERTIDWASLDQAHISPTAQDFIRRLLDVNPRTRMSLSDATKHPWLQNQQEVLNRGRPRETLAEASIVSLPVEGSSLSSIPDDDDEMADDTNSDPIINQGLEHLKLRGNTRAPLQRRSQVLSQAAEDNQALMEPSWQMIASQDAELNQNQDPNQLQIQAGPGPTTRAHKRKASDGLGVMREGGAENASPTHAIEGARKKGRGSSDSDSPPKARGTGSKATRGRGRGSASAAAPRSKLHEAAQGMRVEEEHMNDDDDDESPPLQRPRRSTRHSPQKVARRS
ncbi:kinase-like domain-containing protein [Hygrophoropsis aurantiaca]|uniref:Kinase-like domain-containing protein n=1 Tax=Hygrophoropsis aurantiaca TaxID=72124 RepID=A0ACB8AT88_9AGAM|nr:kinase-like domain-containing protein [Hygrophoropsis aurantiaca]